MNKVNRDKPVVIEDLLRIKRAERPAEEFWQEWDKRFKERRREAMLEPRSWLREATSRFGLAVARWYLPVGAAAVVTMTVLAVREYNPTVETPGFSGSVAALDTLAAVPPAPESAGRDVLGELRQVATVDARGTSAQGRQPGALSNLVAGVEQEDTLSPTEKAIAANLAAMHALEPELAHSWRGRSFVLPAASGNALDEEPLAGIAAARDFRRSRMLGFDFQPASANETPAYSRQQERSISRLAEDQLYEAKVRSLGARGDRVLVRF